MRRILPFLVLVFAGCTNAPIAGLLDNCFPCRTKEKENPNPDRGPKPGVDVRPLPPGDPLRTTPVPGPTVNPGPIPPPADVFQRP
jgi:hypothetical protein